MISPSIQTLIATNPNLTPKYLLELIADVLSYHKIRFADRPPNDTLTSPIIIGKVSKRVRDLVKGQGRTFSGFHGSAEGGTVNQRYQQNYNLLVDFVLYYPISLDISEMAWDIEQSIQDSRGIFQTRYPTSEITWRETIIETDPNSKGEIGKVTLRFEVKLAVYTVRPSKVISNIQFSVIGDGLYYDNIKLVRSSEDETYTISTDNGLVVTSVLEIKLYRNGRYVILTRGTDYTLEKVDNRQNSSYYIKWALKTGLYPNLDEEFWISYLTSSRLTFNS